MKEVMTRMPPALIARADAYASDMSTRTGLTVSRSDVLRMALIRMLDAEGVEEAPAKPSAAKPPRSTMRLQHGPDGSVLGPKKAKRSEPEIDSSIDLGALPNPFA